MRIIAHIASRILGSGLSAPSQCNGQHRRCLRRGIRGEIDLHGVQKKAEFHRRLPAPSRDSPRGVAHPDFFSERRANTRQGLDLCSSRENADIISEGVRRYTAQPRPHGALHPRPASRVPRRPHSVGGRSNSSSASRSSTAPPLSAVLSGARARAASDADCDAPQKYRDERRVNKRSSQQRFND
jgi:hypothetical protein